MRGTTPWEGLERQRLTKRGQHMERAQPGLRPDPSQPAGADRLPQVKHLVVLMMENHSFDNYLGTLGRGEGLPLGSDGQPDAENHDDSGRAVRAYHLPSTAQHSGVPCQSWRAAHEQFAEGKMTGFVAATPAVTSAAYTAADKSVAMGYWTAADLPFYHGLAGTFPLADHWFSSCLGPTFPNRRFLLAGTAHGLMDDLPVNLLDYRRPALSWTCSPSTASPGSTTTVTASTSPRSGATRAIGGGGRNTTCGRSADRSSARERE